MGYNAEDLIISKLTWIQQLQSAIQMSDINQLIMADSLDWNYIKYWIEKLHLSTFDLIPDK
jgi:hypothetical protein